MDPSILRNLDTQSRRLGEIETEVDRLLDGAADVEPGRWNTAGGAAGYEGLTAAHDALRDARGWTDVDLADAMTPRQAAAFENWRAQQRIAWRAEDVVAVGLAVAVGFVATWFDAELDRTLRERLRGLRNSDLVRAWEKDARGLAIDYTGPGFGGPDHRVRSSGHDLGRPVAALRQIRDGIFEGERWENNAMETVTVGGFVRAESLPHALALWVKHLAADVVTTMSLPLPGWTYLYRMPDHELRKFAHDVYRGRSPGEGLNLRSGTVTPSLSVLATDTIVRAHVRARTMVSPDRSPGAADEALQHELLLAAHSAVAVAGLGKALGRALATGSGPMALRHISIPVFIRVGMLAMQVRADGRDRRDASAGDWADLLDDARRRPRVGQLPTTTMPSSSE